MIEYAIQQKEQPEEITSRVTGLWWALVVVIFAIGVGIRLFDLTDAPLDFNPTRQLHSALIARGMYYEHLAGVPEWKREMAVAQWHAEGVIEPQVFERLVAWTYALAGGDYLWIPRLYAILFWTLGGIALLWLAKEFAGREGALVALLFYMVWPFAAIASRSFQPDPLMVALILWTLWALLHWQKTPTWGWSVATGLLAGAAIFVKSVAVFFVAPALVVIVLTTLGLKAAVRSPKIWLMAFLSLFLFALYYIDGVFISHFLTDQFSMQLSPQLWRDPQWYLLWNRAITHAVGLELCLAAFASTLLIARKDLRLLLLGLWAGYVAFGFTAAYAYSTHDYYQLPLFVMVPLGLAVLAGLIIRHMRGPAWLSVILLSAMVLWGTAVKSWDVIVTLKRDNYRVEERFWEKLSQQLPENAKVVGLLHDYGFRLAYWGWIEPQVWMSSADFNLREMTGQKIDMQNEFQEKLAGEDFFVVTLMTDYQSQPALKSFLEKNYPVYKQAADYIIFDLRNPISRPPG
jgi:hypothetical protein